MYMYGTCMYQYVCTKVLSNYNVFDFIAGFTRACRSKAIQIRGTSVITRLDIESIEENVIGQQA